MSLGQPRRSFGTDYEDSSGELSGGRRLQSSTSQYTATANLLPGDSLSIPLTDFPDGAADDECEEALGDGAWFAKRCQCCRISKPGCAVVLAIVVAVLGVLTLLLSCVVGPGMAQMALQRSTLSLVNCSMHDADNSSIGLDCHVRLDNAGGIKATLHELDVDVLHRETGSIFMTEIFRTTWIPWEESQWWRRGHDTQWLLLKTMYYGCGDSTVLVKWEPETRVYFCFQSLSGPCVNFVQQTFPLGTGIRQL